MKTMLGTVLAVSLACFAMPVLAGDAKVGTMEIHDAWARATPAKAPAGGAFLTLINTGTAADTLVAASGTVARSVELHTHKVEGDVMRMMKVDGVEVPAGATVAMAPGGYHIMLIGLEAPLVEGTSFPLELTFAQAGKVTVTVDVKAVGAMGGMGSMGHMHGMGN